VRRLNLGGPRRNFLSRDEPPIATADEKTVSFVSLVAGEHFLALLELWEKYDYAYLRGDPDVNGICDRHSVQSVAVVKDSKLETRP
jgi:hypothetical protein